MKGSYKVASTVPFDVVERTSKDSNGQITYILRLAGFSNTIFSLFMIVLLYSDCWNLEL